MINLENDDLENDDVDRLMNEREEAIWHAAYAAAFVVDLDRSYLIFANSGSDSLVPEDEGSALSAAMRVTDAERASTIADHAVREHRRFEPAEPLTPDLWHFQEKNWPSLNDPKASLCDVPGGDCTRQVENVNCEACLRLLNDYLQKGFK